jgi:glucans biosynthesis protein C
MDSPTPTASTGRRRKDLDLIRIAVVGGLVLYHTACVFVPGEFYVSNQPTSFGMTLLVFFTKLWAMPLLFIVAGAGAWHSLERRTVGAFARERVSRLLVPLVVGVLLIVPPQVYFALRARGQDPGSYWHFLGRFFDVQVIGSFPSFLRGANSDTLFELGHLWFLHHLLVYSLVLLPVFLFLRSDRGRSLRARLTTACCQRRLGLTILAVPVVLVESVGGTWGPGGWNSYSFVLFLILGYLIAADHRLSEAIGQNWKAILVVGAAIMPILFVIAHYDLGGAGRNLGTDYDPWSVAFRLLKAAAGCAWTFVLLGLATFLAQRRAGPVRPAGNGGRLRDWAARNANEAVLPLYVLHQTPIVIIAFYVVQWRVGILPKYLIISAGSMVVTVLIYALCVRRAPVTRMLFGMPRSGMAQMRPQPSVSGRPQSP